ncbi:MAG TPA: sugar ABC transporter substrate-binding protein [Lachnoclostridium phytofermentans]|uniref:Sugar ABC transporter substrate-binding protein n=1 Tax=Lachnoclostridium phytofermentans TaxID=66219 RepID=A0A3D2X3Q4_9FIRM|nr:sugar ABC transporter substrate-binding protein [Lachnoclostridium sp.]HCL01790.1 sugar ABC transporter substrate-binding protein [Lachnoclostridium phytofermentans]
MKKKLVALCVFSLALVTIFTGCSKSKESSAKGEKAKIRFASWDTADGVDDQQALVDKFNAAHDDIEVTLEAYGSDFDTKISAGMGSGDAPDVMYMWNYPAYFGGLEPLDGYIDKEGDNYKSNFYETLWNYNSINDQVYGIPIGFTTHALFYNKDIFAEAGLAEPTADWTWEDLKAAAKTITEKTSAVGFSFQMKPDPYDFEMYLWSNGTTYCDKDGKLEGNLNSEKSKEILQMFQDMEKEGYAIASEKSGTDEFRSGVVAMYVYGSWAIDSLKEDKVNYGVTTIPAFANAGKDSVSILSSSGISMSKDSKNKDAAWEFINFWTNEEANKERIGSELPVLNSVVESEKIMEQPEYAPFYVMLEQSKGYTPASFIIKEWSKISENLSLSFEEIFNPSVLQSPSDVLNNAVQQ